MIEDLDRPRRGFFCSTVLTRSILSATPEVAVRSATLGKHRGRLRLTFDQKDPRTHRDGALRPCRNDSGDRRRREAPARVDPDGARCAHPRARPGRALRSRLRARAGSLAVRAGRVRREFGDVERANPRDATPILRDLVARYRLLSHADRTTARGLLARPTDSSDSSEHHYRSGATLGKLCDSTRPLCVHWDEKTNHRDAPPGADNNAATIPADVQATLDTFAGVYDLEVDTYGYLAPLPDGASTPDDGGDDRTDIYLADLGGDVNPFFGYCTTDDPNAFDLDYPYYDVSAYCVVDEDFADFGPPGRSKASATSRRRTSSSMRSSSTTTGSRTSG